MVDLVSKTYKFLSTCGTAITKLMASTIAEIVKAKYDMTLGEDGDGGMDARTARSWVFVSRSNAIEAVGGRDAEKPT